MKEIILTAEQARVIADATEPVEIRDSAGTILVKVDPGDAQALAAHRKRKESGLSEPKIPGHRVQEHLQALQAEWDRTGGFDESYMKGFLAKLRAEEA